MSEDNIYIYGRNPVAEALKEQPEQVDKIFVRENLSNSSIQQILKRASEHKIAVSHVPGPKLYDLVGNVNDQGVVALLSSVSYYEFGEWLDRLDLSVNPAALLLDELEDPQNVGAILRTAAAAGLDGVLVPKHRQTPVNATVYKTSAGTAGRIPIVRIGNVNQTIITLKDEGFWIAGLDQDGDDPFWNQEFDVPMTFIIGSEGTGISQKTLEHCDFRLTIPMQNRVPSLNSSVSAALISYEWRRQQNDREDI